MLIAESFSGVNYDFSFPCPDCFDQGNITEKSMYAASLIRRATKMNAIFLQCRQNFHIVPVIDLHSKMLADTTADNYDLQLRHAVRDLKHLKQSLTYDIVLVYSVKDTQDASILHPKQIRQDLNKAGYSCYFTQDSNQITLDSIATILHNTNLILICMSDNFVNDLQCAQIFKYIKLNLNKSYVLVVLGDSFEWQTTEIGCLITHELFIKINKIERYKSCLPDLLELIKKKLEIKANKISKKLSQNHEQIFISYCRSNSHDAIAKGTPLKSKDSLGWCDPRSLKTYLENEGYSCWIDFEQVGSKKTLFEDIVDGIRNSKVIVACVSNEYAKSENCMKEFRFASNLKMPIIICLFGSPDVACQWRSTELGIISCLISKEINFQLENPNAYQSLLNEIQSFNIMPILASKVEMKLLSIPSSLVVAATEEEKQNNAETKLAFKELTELAQRKFLRQIAKFSDTASSRPFPRLFIIDLILNQDEIIITNKSSRFCFKALCESETGWHFVKNKTIEYEIISNIPEVHFPYLIRIMSLIKESDLDLGILKSSGKLDEIISYLDENLERSNQIQDITFKESYNSVKNYLQLKLEALKSKNKLIDETNNNNNNNYNQNRIDHFKLNRCGLPSGKILWLCDKHSQNEYVHVLTSNQNVSMPQYQNDEFNSILFEELKKYDTITPKL